MTFKSFETVIKSLIEHYEKDQDKCYDTETNELTCELCLIWQDFKANHNNLRILCGYLDTYFKGNIKMTDLLDESIEGLEDEY